MVGALIVPLLGLFALQLLYFVFVPRQSDHVPTGPEQRLLKQLRWTGTVVLVVGLLAAGWVYEHTPPVGPDPGEVTGYEIGAGYAVPFVGPTKKAALQEEKIGGKFGVMLEKVEPWFVEQWHGRRLATTLLVLSGAIFFACLIWARILTFPEPAPAP